MPQLEPLNLRITGDPRGLSQALGRSQGDTRRFADGLDAQASKLRGGLNSLAAGFGPIGIAAGAAFAAVAAGAGTAYVAISKIAEVQSQITETARAADRLNVSFNELGGFEFAVLQTSGAEADVARDALKEIQIRLSEAKDGAGAAKDALDRLGLDAGELIEQGPLRALQAISEEFRKVENGSEQTRIANDLLGEAGAQLVSTLRAGREEIEQAAAFQEQWAGLTSEQVAAVEANSQAWSEVRLVIDGIFQELAAEFAPAMLVLAEEVLGVADEFGGVEQIVRDIVDAIVTAVGWAVDLGEVLTATSRAWVSLLTGQLEQIPEILNDAFDFSTADRYLEKIEAKRNEILANVRDSEAQSSVLAALKQENAVAKETAKTFQDAAKTMEKLRSPVGTAAVLRGSSEDLQLANQRQRDRVVNPPIQDALKRLEQILKGQKSQPAPQPPGEIARQNQIVAHLERIEANTSRGEPRPLSI